MDQGGTTIAPKLAADVAYCSGSADDFPVDELMRHTRNTRGWHSPKLAEYPVEIVFRFGGEVQLSCLRLLAHESKIPSKIDIYVAASPPPIDGQQQRHPPLNSVEFTRLGFLSFSTNEASRLMSRELKTAHLSTRCVYVKLVVRGCHPNAINVFNQAGLIAVALHGSIITPFALPVGAMQHRIEGLDAEVPMSALHPQAVAPIDSPIVASQASQRSLGGTGVGAVPGAGDSDTGAVDAVTAKRVKELLLHKAKAVAEEDYDLAKHLKEQIDRLRNAGAEIAELEEQKRAAVESEDYDVAKVLKRKIDELRAAASADPKARAVGSARPPSSRQRGTSEGAPVGGSSVPFDEQPVGGSTKRPTVPFDDQFVGPSSKGAQSMSEYPEVDAKSGKQASTRPAPPAPGKTAAPRPDAVNEHDEKAAAVKAKTLDELIAEQEAAMADGAAVGFSKAAQAAADRENMDPWVRDFNLEVQRLAPGEAGGNDQLPEIKLTELADPWVSTFGSFATCALFGRKWQWRDAALRAAITGGGFAALTDPTKPRAAASGHVVQTVLKYLSSKGVGINDSIATVFFTVCDVLKAVVSEDLPEVSLASVSGGVTPLISPLVLKAGDSNQRVREAAQTTLLLIAMSSIGCERVAHSLLRDPQKDSKRPVNFRVQLARLSLAKLLIEKMGLANQSRRNGLAPDALMADLVVPQLPHTNADVREAAIVLVAIVKQLAPGAVTKGLSNVKAAQKQAIDDFLADGEKLEAATSGLRSGPAASGATPVKPGERKKAGGEMELVSESISVGRGGAGRKVLDAARAAAKHSGDQPDTKPTEKLASKPVAKPSAKPSAAGDKKKSVAVNKSTDGLSAAEREARTCQFCGKFDRRFDEKTLDLHYVHTCPLLCPCPLCGQITEIPLLQEHLVEECDHCELVRQCPICREAVRKEDLDAHVSARACIEAKEDKYNVCPLCHDKLPPGEAGWDGHFMETPGCSKNPRKFDGGGDKEFELSH